MLLKFLFSIRLYSSLIRRKIMDVERMSSLTRRVSRYPKWKTAHPLRNARLWRRFSAVLKSISVMKHRMRYYISTRFSFTYLPTLHPRSAGTWNTIRWPLKYLGYPLQIIRCITFLWRLLVKKIKKKKIYSNICFIWKYYLHKTSNRFFFYFYITRIKIKNKFYAV